MKLFSFRKKSGLINTTDKEFFFPYGDGVSVFGELSPRKHLDYFLKVPELNLAITTKARMASNMILTVKNRVTGEDVPDTDTIQHLLKNPNWWQSQKELIIQHKIFREIHGDSYLFALKPVGFGIERAKQLSTLNPLFMVPKHYYSKIPNFLNVEAPQGSGWNYSYRGVPYYIDAADVMHSNNNNVQNDKDMGISPLRALRPNLDNIISAYEARGKNLRAHGAVGILSNAGKDGIGGTAPLDPDDKNELQKNLKQYGILKKQWSHIITNLNLTWQKMGANTKDLMLFEEIESDFQTICDNYGMNRQLFATVKGATFSNQKEAEKQTYTNTIIPETQELVDGLNKFFKMEGTPNVITAEFKHLAIFEEDKKARGQSIILTTNALSKAYADKAIDLAQYQSELAKFGI